MAFRDNLIKLRTESQLTQEKLAEKINVTRAAVGKWEAGNGTPNIENLVKLSNLFNVTVDELLKGEPIFEPKTPPSIKGAVAGLKIFSEALQNLEEEMSSKN